MSQGPTKLELDFAQTIREGLVGSTLSSCYRWAQKRRIMPSLMDPEKLVYFSAKYHPWVVEMHDPKSSFLYIMKGAQLGATEAAINRCFYLLDEKKRDVLYVLPTALNATDFSKSRFKIALDNSEHLKRLFTDTNTVQLKQAGASTLYIRGSRGDSNLKSIPVHSLILDEVDEMDQKQINLALERLSGKVKGQREAFGLSTPTIPEYGIHKLYKRGTQEHFIFKCPSCSRKTELVWPDCVEIIGEHVSDPRCFESYLKCKECGAKLPHEAKPEWLRDTKFVSQNRQGNRDFRSMHISQLYSFTITPGDLVVAHFRGFGDELAAKEFHNSKLGLPYIGEGAKIDDEMLDNCVRDYSMDDPRPKDTSRFVTMGVDQGKWSYASICEWFLPRKLGNDLNLEAMCKVLWVGRFFEDDWHLLDEWMYEWQVQACVIDADPEINEARRFARRFHGHVWLCRYRRGQSQREITVTDEDDAPLATVDRSNWLSASTGRFKTREPRIHLPKDIPQEYRDHLSALVRTYVRDVTKEAAKKGSKGNAKLEFVSVGADHYAHAQNYAEIALPLAASRQYNTDIRSLV